MRTVLIFVGILLLVSCEQTGLAEQKVFENLGDCCPTSDAVCIDSYKKGYTFYDIVGRTETATSSNQGVLFYDMIIADTLHKIKLPTGVLPLFHYCKDLVACNMPKEILHDRRSRKVKVSFRAPYIPLGQHPPECIGLFGQILRIELLD